MLVDEIKKALHIPDYEDMGANNWKLWQDLYREEYFYSDAELYHLGLPASIVSEIAKASIIELETYLETDGALEVDYQRFIEQLGKVSELACAFGGVILKPFAMGDRIGVDVLTPELFIIEHVNELKEIDKLICLDTEEATNEKGEKLYYTKLERHDFTQEGRYIIKNEVYVSSNKASLGEPASLEAVERWQGLNEETPIENAKKPLYTYLKYPTSNNLDWHSPLGMSAFCRAIGLIQEADEQFSRIIWEYKGSELAIDANIEVLKASGDMPKHGDRLFRNLGVGVGEGFYEVFNPTIRDSALFHGLNELLRKIEFNCGLSYGILSDVGEQVKTATEMKMSRQRFYTTVSDFQRAIKNALNDLVYAMALIKYDTEKEIEVILNFDDSLLVDKEAEQKLMLTEVSAGILRPEYYLMKRYNVNEAEARAMLPSAEIDSLDDGIE